MYIGPWQEYKLSQARRPQPPPNPIGSDIRNDLQKTLLQTLSPEDVAKVMAAMNPLLSGPSATTADHAALPPLPSGRRHQSRRPHRFVDREQPTLHDQFKLPRVDTKYRVDGSSPGANGTPQSVRSSKSEPLHSSRVVQRARHDIRAFSPPASTKATGCDSSNLVATLRLERRNRPTLHDTIKKTDFGQFWGWKQGGTSDDTGSETGAQESKSSKAENSMESKIARVKNMQKLYTTKPEQYVLPTLEPITVDVSSSPMRTYKKPQTPIVEDRDLTSSDIAVVSKYFNYNRSTSFLSDIAASPKNVDSVSLPAKSKSIASPVSLSKKEDKDLDFASADDPSIHQFQEHSRIICSPVQVMDTPMAGNYNSPDGLLHWTSMLDIDEIDKLY